MLSKILSKSDCASCKFCCSFRRQSLWETPIFTFDDVEKLQKLYPGVKFKPTGKSSFTFDISQNYKTQNPEEEAACPFLDSKKGCVLPPELKPFDCSIWPLRAVRVPITNQNDNKISAENSNESSKIKVALTPTCPAINKVPLQSVKNLVNEGLGQKILESAAKNPDMIKEFSDFFILL